MKTKMLSSAIALTLSAMLTATPQAMAVSGDAGGIEQTNLPVIVIKAQVDGNLNGSFTKEGYSIFFEAQRGEQNIGNDPDAPPFGLDIVIMDNNHIPFIVQKGGGNLINSHEEQDNSEQLPNFEEDRRKAIAMLPDVIKTLKDLYVNVGTEDRIGIEGVTQRNRWEIWEIISLMRSVTEDLSIKDNSAGGGNIKPLATSASKYTHEVTITKKSVGSGLEHSALMLKIYDSKGSKIFSMRTCNHGACADDKSMSKKCSNKFTKNHRNAYGVYFGDCDATAGSPYTWLGGGNSFNLIYFFGHSCNSDTKTEYLSIKNSQDKDWGYCWRPLLTAPSCD